MGYFFMSFTVNSRDCHLRQWLLSLPVAFMYYRKVGSYSFPLCHHSEDNEKQHMHSFIFPFNKYFIEFLLCSIHFARNWGSSDEEQTKICLFMEFVFQSVVRRTQCKQFPLSQGRHSRHQIFLRFTYSTPSTLVHSSRQVRITNNPHTQEA